jgi:hypothetical protein
MWRWYVSACSNGKATRLHIRSTLGEMGVWFAKKDVTAGGPNFSCLHFSFCHVMERDALRLKIQFGSRQAVCIPSSWKWAMLTSTDQWLEASSFHIWQGDYGSNQALSAHILCHLNMMLWVYDEINPMWHDPWWWLLMAAVVFSRRGLIFDTESYFILILGKGRWEGLARCLISSLSCRL